MAALHGSIAERARATLAAGCDLALHCNGKMDEMKMLGEAVPEISLVTMQRLSRAKPLPAPGKAPALQARLDALMAANA
jgi:beta-N-acetylhexosaminidase